MSSMYIVAIINAIRSIFLANWHAAETAWKIIINELFGCKWDIYTQNQKILNI